MLYDNIYYLGQIFQLFLQDAAARPEYVRHALASDDVVCTGVDVRPGGHLLAWLERRNIVMDVTHKATLLQMANAFEALPVRLRHTQIHAVDGAGRAPLKC